MSHAEQAALIKAIKSKKDPSQIDPDLKRGEVIDYIYAHGTYPPTGEGVYSFEEHNHQHIVFFD